MREQIVKEFMWRNRIPSGHHDYYVQINLEDEIQKWLLQNTAYKLDKTEIIGGNPDKLDGVRVLAYFVLKVH